MNLAGYFSFLFSPVLFAFFLFYLNYKFKIHVWKNIFMTFLWGMAAIILVVAANEIIRIWGWQHLKNMRRTAFYVFVVVAFSAELGKFLYLRYLFHHQKSFNSPLAGIIYGICVSLGFSLVAVILYGIGFIGTEKMKYLVLFLWTYPLANVIFGVVQGFFLGMGKVRKYSIIDEGTALGTATFFHALFYFCFLTSDQRLLVITAIGLIFIASILLVKAAAIQPGTTE
jgi:RsiW-degrading membrane proteinase PrsW (M82 family)